MFEPRRLDHCLVLLWIGEALALSASGNASGAAGRLQKAPLYQIRFENENDRIAQVRRNPGTTFVNALNFT